MTTLITGGEAVYRVLKANGIDTVFWLVGRFNAGAVRRHV